VALTGMVRHIPRAIDISREFRRRGKKTIIGGVAAYALHDAVQKEFDAHVDGEVDEQWPQILDDFERGRLQPYYKIDRLPELTNMPIPRYELLPMDRYIKPLHNRAQPIISIETSRGCPHSCSYCLVSQYLGRKVRYRPIGDVVEEIKRMRSKVISFADDNLLIDPSRGRELLKALKPLGIRWFAQCESSIIRHPDLLDLARDSGCLMMLIGIESTNPDNLVSLNKKALSKFSLEEIAHTLRDHGVPLFASMIFGLDYDTPESIQASFHELNRLEVPLLAPWVLTPVPRTALHANLEREGRILHKNYSLYDYVSVVIRPKRMSSQVLEKTFWKGCRQFYSRRNTLRILLKSKVFPFHLAVVHAVYSARIRHDKHPSIF
jgi:radical SAM superfamily enzyme YgiQ (UPF0313 family)